MITEDVFKIFLGGDPLRPAMQKPFEINGKVYATDGYSLIRCDKSNIDFSIDSPHNPPDCEAIIPKPNMSKIVDIQKSELETYKTEDEYEDTGEDIECKTCDGHGDVEWSFESHTMDADCPDCNGSGFEEQTKKVKTGGKTFGTDYVKIVHTIIAMRLFYRLLQVAEIIGCEIELLGLSGPNKAVMFRIGLCEIVLMPVIYNESENEPLIIKLK